MNFPATIFSYIKTEESNFNSQEIQVYDNKSFNLKNHIQTSLQLKYGWFTQGENNYNRPFKKIIGPLLELRYRAEDIEVKDIVFYIERSNGRILSFFIKKYWDDVYTKEYNFDGFIDELGEEEIDLGGVLIKKGKGIPEVLPLQYLAFADQTNILGGPMGFKHYFAPSALKDMEALGWGDFLN